MYSGHLCGPTIHVASGQAWLSPRSTLYMYICHVLYWICVCISWSSDDLQRFRKTIVFLYVPCLWPHTQPVSPNQCMLWLLNTLRPRQNGRHFADDIFKCILFNENAGIALKISLMFVPKVRINNIPALVQIMAWRRPGDKPLSEPMMVSLLAYICVTRPQWVK